MSDRVSIPLVLRSPDADRLVFSIPVWYRTIMFGILAILLGGLFQLDGSPGGLACALLVIVAAGALYEEKWTFDAGQGQVTYRTGLIIAARSSVIDFKTIERFRIAPHVEGTIPGTEDERAENAAALKGGRGDDAGLKRSRHKKPFLALVMECEGTHYLVDRVPARKAARLRELSARMADFCGKPLVNGDSE